MDGWREVLGERAEGCVLEVGVGTGLNLPFYRGVDGVVGVDSSLGMLGRGVDRCLDLDVGFDVSFLLMSVESLGFRDSCFDTVVSSFLLCNVDSGRGLGEIERVLRPGGRLLLLEHVRPENRFLDFLFRLVNPVSVWVLGDDLRGEPVKYLEERGFRIDCVKRFGGFLLFVECRVE
ncbi:class I SAM-dependent methyltransferase [Methanonatronarchaeum thermophilum]|uniref:class I SAM-dependent methyltransferase n=1 Tax=Methanonatronarchaeum thermophilum TaxID=1927129 RepID=UPI00137473A3|nr:class I SAM-dependent methyltransferase [Methanonatronarchaeum thermophilum]